MPGASFLSIIDFKRKLLKSENLHTEEDATVNAEVAALGSYLLLSFVITLYEYIFKIRQTIDSFIY